MDVKERLRELMTARGWTIYKVAKEADNPWSTVHNMFKRNTEPSLSTMASICQGMGITLCQFFDAENQLGLTDVQRCLLSEWNKLSPRNQRIIRDLINSLNDGKE